MVKNFLLGVILLFATLTARSADVAYQPLRALWDMSGFPFQELCLTNSPWRLLKITPATDSGLTVGMHINAQTGQLVREPGKEIAVSIKGTVEEIARPGARSAVRGKENYAWTEPVGVRVKDIRPRLYAPFRSGGTIVSRFSGPASDERQFAPWFAVPEGWTESTFLGFCAVRADEARQQAESDSGRVKARIQQQLAGQNPIVALHAFQALSGLGGPGNTATAAITADLTDLVKSAAPENRALIITDLIRNQAESSVSPALDRLLGEAKDLTEVEPIALALRSALEFGRVPGAEEPRASCRAALSRCGEIARTLPGSEGLKGRIQKLRACK